jgi:hypothetical protein
VSRVIKLPELPPRVMRQLDAQDWKCAYAACRRGGAIQTGDALAVGYDGNAIVHLTCAHIGNAPHRIRR